ncbi:uncharacterized protein TRUGW13939_09856 [Talaromyces rugulosus]|uniref:Tyrosinase copper-binding domain-containing protein n=1 Tax=Talaromyces rugulosus TaxID=121627 RepID=A0A7H8RB58_TALRU|nr:uncharacterized protein TRUGW13939_09856 [Talaromyces rugulosus]QKX62695.1 hypothetical protein TRUGW13939_09856 [Talaromyces rugulosus]
MSLINQDYINTFSTSLPHGSCTSQNIGVRKEWEILSEDEKNNYLKAVQCLQAKPPQYNDTMALNRYEEFILSHIEQTLKIHISGLLLPWHRYFVSLFEQALRNECGYQGYQPYWDWSKHVIQQNSTIFSGSENSYGGNGEAIPHGEYNITTAGGPPPVTTSLQPPGTGGGCIFGGPFANHNLSIDATNDGASTPVQTFKKPRCLTRDFNLTTLSRQNSYERVTELILNNENIKSFHAQIEDVNGVHFGGHAFIGGENFNLFTSPSDPAFYLHHGMLDRVWAIWQSRDPKTRTYAVDGTSTWANYPPSANVTIDDILEVSSFDSMKIKDVSSTIDGILCYRYQ